MFTSDALSQPEVDARVAARLARAEILQEPGRQFTFVLTASSPCGFDLYEEHTVVVGVIGGSAYYNDPADVAGYVAMLL